ncbi:MAG: hypothetical protein OQL28_09750 [Sedimenticola sp.]|nr:hypothetical protein [Sedimenticola sp.]
MATRSSNRSLKARIAVEAARLIAEQGDLPFEQARRKAAKRLNCRDQRQLPENHEIEQALREHRMIFQGGEDQAHLGRLRRNAVSAMRMFDAFHPLLVGPILVGTAGRHTPITLILFSDTVEAVAMDLLERKIPWQQQDVLLDYTDRGSVRRPLFLFQAGEDPVELLVLPPSDRHNLPLDPIEKRPRKGASLDKVTALFEAGQRLSSDT